MRITEKLFGMVQDEEVKEYTLTNSNDISLSVISYGAIITKICVPDKKGNLENITVNVDTLEEMVENRPFHGAIIGRVSGRISNAKYSDSDEEYQLDQNEGNNTLHGGFNGLDNKIWDVEALEEESQVSLVFSTKSAHLESGFPGNMTIQVTYTLNNRNEVAIHYNANTDQKTLFNPTNHVYFNLSGNNKENIHNHLFQVDSDYYAVLADDNIPTGELKRVESTDFDLRELTKLQVVLESEDMQIKERNGLDHPFVLNKKTDNPSAVLEHEESGRLLFMYTESDSVVIYTHNVDQHPLTENEQVIKAHSGITLETCILPDAVNQKDFGSIYLNPDESFESTTVFRFETKI